MNEAHEGERLALVLAADVSVVRKPRRRLCPRCRHKRVLYAVGVVDSRRDTMGGETEAKCLTCWGVTRG